MANAKTLHIQFCVCCNLGWNGCANRTDHTDRTDRTLSLSLCTIYNLFNLYICIYIFLILFVFCAWSEIAARSMQAARLWLQSAATSTHFIYCIDQSNDSCNNSNNGSISHCLSAAFVFPESSHILKLAPRPTQYLPLQINIDDGWAKHIQTHPTTSKNNGCKVFLMSYSRCHGTHTVSNQ